MRKTYDIQKKIGEIEVDKIQIDLTCRDEVPKLLMGIKYIYSNKNIREEIFRIFEETIPEKSRKRVGRKGMTIWEIFVMGMLRLNCNWDYDKLQDQVNNHATIRQILGISEFNGKRYALKTLCENIALLTPEVLNKINEVVVKAGHKVIGKKAEKGLKVKVDSFVVETDVHFPTDISLLFDATRKMLNMAKNAVKKGFRQTKYQIEDLKKKVMIIQRIKRSTSKDQQKIEDREKLIKKEYKKYIEKCGSLIDKVKQAIKLIPNIAVQAVIEQYICYGKKLIDQIGRRVLRGETIPHDEKIFSIFEEHTEWISKGKAGVPQELGVRVCVVQDQFGFLLNHMVMEKKTDDAVAVPIMEKTKKMFPNIKQGSFDKGFYTPKNKETLEKMVDILVMTRKGKLKREEIEIEKEEDYRKAKRAHRAVESGISALENHGLDRCLDHGIKGFKRYVAYSIAARNIQITGNILIQKELKRIERMKRKMDIKKAA